MKFHSHKEEVNETLPDLLTTTSASEARRIRKVIVTGCGVNLLLMLMKIAVGWYGHSEALVADGFHSLNDMAVDLVMLVFVGWSYKKANSRFAYGYGKFETFSSLMISLLMITIATLIFIEGVKSIIGFAHGEVLERPDIWTLVAIIVAICCKEGLYRYYTTTGKRMDSTALQGAGWHHRLDAMASVATLIGVTCAHFLGEKFHVFDPIASLVIAITILFPAFRLMVPSFRELMDGSLPDRDTEKAMRTVEEVPGVLGIDHLKARRSGHSRIFDIKIRVAHGTTVEQGEVITSDIEKALEKNFCPHIYVSVQTRA